MVYKELCSIGAEKKTSLAGARAELVLGGGGVDLAREVKETELLAAIQTSPITIAFPPGCFRPGVLLSMPMFRFFSLPLLVDILNPYDIVTTQ